MHVCVCVCAYVCVCLCVCVCVYVCLYLCLCRTWSELFPPVFPNDTCGYSFKSAFYDPGVSSSYPDDLMTPALTARPAMLSRVSAVVVVVVQYG